MLSLHTNFGSLAAENALTNSQTLLATSQTRLSTGYKINSAMDDAAGLQIATRLKSQTSGMAVAMRNTQNATSVLQTAEGAFSEVTSMLLRMKDLATQASDGSSSADDKTAMQSEYDALGNQLGQIMANTTYGGMNLMSVGTTSGVLASSSGITFQIGATTSETFKLDLSAAFTTVSTALTAATSNFDVNGVAQSTPGTELTGPGASGSGANTFIDILNTAISDVGAIRSSLGASANRLNHVYNNLQNESTNTTQATSRIMDTDYATETSNMTTQQMLAQAGTAMLKQSGQMSQMVLSLLQ